MSITDWSNNEYVGYDVIAGETESESDLGDLNNVQPWCPNTPGPSPATTVDDTPPLKAQANDTDLVRVYFSNH